MGYVAIVVDDYDRAIEYYTGKLGFILVEAPQQVSAGYPGSTCLMRPNHGALPNVMVNFLILLRES